MGVYRHQSVLLRYYSKKVGVNIRNELASALCVVCTSGHASSSPESTNVRSVERRVAASGGSNS